MNSPMMLRRKIVVSVFLLVVLGAILQAVLYCRVLLPSYEVLEREGARREIQRAVAALRNDIEHLRLFAADWGTWDDTCRFVEDRNPEYVRSNLGLPTFVQNDLALIGILGRSGQALWLQAYDRGTQSAMKLTEFPETGLPADHPLLRRERADSAIAGLLSTSAGPMLVASVPIVASDGRGPTQGVLIMARRLDTACQRKLRRQTQVDFQLRPAGADLPGGAAGDPDRIEIQKRADAFLAGTVLRDIAGRPLLVLEAHVPRRIMARGLASLRMAVLSSAATAAVLLLLLTWLVQRMIVQPLRRIQRHAAAISQSGDLTRRLALGAGDEIGLLGREFDLLLDRVQALTEGLDTRVRKRTEELEATNLSLQASRQEAVSLMQEAVAAREQAEQAGKELCHEVAERRQVEEALRDLNATLESKVADRTAELQHRTRQLQRMTLELSLAEERERKRMAEILHEELQQQIAGAKLQLHLLSRTDEDSPGQVTTAEIDQILKDAIGVSSRLSQELDPAVFYRNDLVEAVGWLARHMKASKGLTVHVDTCGEGPLESESVTVFLFRATRELLSNVLRHAGVREARVRLRRKGRYVGLCISDRGRGFDLKDLKNSAGFGLPSIRERVELLGGRMKIKSAPGQGSTFRLVVPDERRKKDAE